MGGWFVRTKASSRIASNPLAPYQLFLAFNVISKLVYINTILAQYLACIVE